MYTKNIQKMPCNCEMQNNMPMETTCSYVQNLADTDYNSCACGFDDGNYMFPQNPMFGQSYVPWQIMNKTFTPEVGLKMGTIFPELVSPYSPGQSQAEIEYIAATNAIKEGCNKC